MTVAESKYNRFILILAVLLLFPAFFINLGKLPLIADEATRATVSLEMEISGNLIIPTINGEQYLNKPPLYNWILLAFYKLSHSHSEWIIRLPAVISLLLFGLIVFLSARKQTGSRPALLAAFGLVTTGRILFYDSLLGLIDLSFSLLIFLNFLVIFHFIKKRNYFALYLLSYTITAAAFLMKGLPAVVFQGLSIVTGLAFFKSLKKILNPWHAAGLLVFIITAGSYYFLLWKANPGMQYLDALVNESAKRTFLVHGLWKTILHLFIFPAEQFLHFAPWSVFFVFLFQRSFYKHIMENEFLSFLALIFLVNIPVYWISVESYPRYIFMLYPIVLLITFHHLCKLNTGDPFSVYTWLLFLVASLAALPVAAFLYFRHDFHFPVNPGIVIGFVLLLLVLLFILWKWKAFRPEMLVIILLVTRIGFNLLIIPERYHGGRAVIQKQQAIKAAEISKNSPLRLHHHTSVSIETIFYISKERKEILEKNHNAFTENCYYIFDAREPLRPGEIPVYEFESRWKERMMRLSEFRQ